MHHMRPLKFTGLFLGLTLLSSAFAQSGPTLVPGSKAPALTIGKWLKGTPVEKFESGKIYVVEFWATWCGPCKVSIPHLTELNKKYEGKVTIIGVSSFEDNWSKVEPFVTEMGDKMDYNIATDNSKNGERSADMAKNWMDAAGAQGIPTAFVVGKDGVVEWIGHPMEMDKVLENVVAGTWNRAEYLKNEAAKKAEADKKMEAIRSSKAFRLAADARRLIGAKDYDKALAVTEELAKAEQVQGIPPIPYTVWQLQSKIAVATKNWKLYSKTGNMLVDKLSNQAGPLNALAWQIAGPDSKLESRDYKLAIRAAEAAVKASNNNPGIMDTLAWAYFGAGMKQKAIETEKKAIELSPESEKAELQKSLAEFQK